MVQIENLKKSYSKKLVFDIPSFSLERGFTCIMGASGCGKTTLGRIICGLEKADSGKVSGINGAPLILFQESRLLPSVSAYGNITAVCRTDEGKALGKELLLQRLSFTEEDLKKRPSELSGGMQRRVAIVRAIVFAIENEGNTAVLDEPFSGLDETTRAAASSVIKDYLGHRAVLVITHDGDECALLNGRTVEFSSLLASNTEI